MRSRKVRAGAACRPDENVLKLQCNSAYLLGAGLICAGWLFGSERKDTENSTAEEGGYPAFAGRVKRKRRFLPRP